MFVHGGLAVLDSGCPRATQRPGRRRHGGPAPATRETNEPPRAAGLPGAAELMGAPCRSGMGVKLPGPLRGDGLGNHRVHDILLACGPPCSGAAIDIVLEGYDVPAAPKSSVASLMGDPDAVVIVGRSEGRLVPCMGPRRRGPGRELGGNTDTTIAVISTFISSISLAGVVVTLFLESRQLWSSR